MKTRDNSRVRPLTMDVIVCGHQDGKTHNKNKNPKLLQHIEHVLFQSIYPIVYSKR
jgi:hypothetical protein